MIYTCTNNRNLRKQSKKIRHYSFSSHESTLIIKGFTKFVYGLGERFNSVNQLGKIVENKVVDQYCEQDSETYFPLPFFILENGVGVFIDTNCVFTMDFKDPIIINDLPDDDDIYIFMGSYKEIISDFVNLTGEQLKPPKWIFGPWFSAHRWNGEKTVRDVLSKIQDLHLPITAIVIEQWSDEETFYIFNGAKHQLSDKHYQYNDFSFEDNLLWLDPEKLIDDIHSLDIKVILWQTSVIKNTDESKNVGCQHVMDTNYAIKHNLVVFEGGEPYRIPDGNWFAGSMIPDFTNPDTIEWWFKKRRYLNEIGIDGFKTDGGEFIYSDDLIFHNSLTGEQMVNDYARLYIEEYKNHINPKQILFSRAGYIGQQKNTITWAGDQKSTWKEFRSQYNAGLSASLSGQHLWSFDIAGFSGELPSAELYVRSTQLALFTPVMQLHSEPVINADGEFDSSEELNNERTPWNILSKLDEFDLLQHIVDLYCFRMNILPYIYSEMLKAISDKSTLMRTLIIDYPHDNNVLLIDDQHLFGDIMVCPMINEGQCERKIYLPDGYWIDITTNILYAGNNEYLINAGIKKFIALIKSGKALVTKKSDLFGDSSNSVDYDSLYVHLYGNTGEYAYYSDDEFFIIRWEDNSYEIDGKVNSKLNIIFESLVQDKC